jgi:glycosyltransferase involved in cell wall biosynthesis
MKVTTLAILIPVYNESECIDLLYDRLRRVMDMLPCSVELLFVNDGSKDDTLSKIKKLRETDERIAYIDLSRNYGKETAMMAGIDHAECDALAIIDADLQDPPELILQMLRDIENGYDDAYAQRIHRKEETWLKRFTSKLYYHWMDKLSDIPVQKDTGDFRMLSRKAVEALKRLSETERNTKGLFSYIGFRKNAILYERDARIAGRTKWNYGKLILLAIKGFTSFSVIPLRIVSIIGIAVSVAAFILLVKVLIQAILYGDPVAGYPSMMCVFLLVGGCILLALGIIGEYLGIIYKETKRRPAYFINEKS